MDISAKLLVYCFLQSSKLFPTTAEGSIHTQHVEPYSFRQGATLSNSDLVSFLQPDECRRYMCRCILVTLFVTVVLRDVVQVVPSQNESTLHLYTAVKSTGNKTLGTIIARNKLRTLKVLTIPVIIRPRIDTLPVKGHFLST